MDDKKAYEAFRVRKFAQPHPALLREGGHRHARTDDSDNGHLSLNEDEDAVNFFTNEANSVHGVSDQVPQEKCRVILHFDCDCFYAQVEEVRNPALRQVPLGVTQKYLIVTCNYLARAAGVTKLMGIRDAMAKCPGLVLVSGEDLGPYRQASKAIHAVLSRYGPAEKLGMDETFVDVTQEVLRRVHSGTYDPPAAPARFVGHLHTARCAVAADTSYRPQDLRAVVAPQAPTAPIGASATGPSGGPSLTPNTPPRYGVDSDGNGSAPGGSSGAGAGGSIGGAGSSGGSGSAAAKWPVEAEVPVEGGGGGAGGAGGGGGVGAGEDWELLLAVGSMLAAEARAAVRAETGFRSSAGIAHNKMLAKLVSGLHKPDDQTVIMPDQATDFVAPLPVRALPGVGYKMERVLTEQLGVSTAADVRRFARQLLVEKLGYKAGILLWHLCRGQDPTPVRPTGPPRSITVEDSFKSCPSWPAAGAVLRVLAPDLLQRLHDEYTENRRRAETLTIKWRLRGTGWSRSSASCAMPLPPGALAAPPTQAQVDQLVRAATQLLQKQLREPFNLSLLNLGASNFKQDGPGGAAAGGSGTGAGGGGSGGTILDLLTRRAKTVADAATACGSAARASSATAGAIAPIAAVAEGRSPGMVASGRGNAVGGGPAAAAAIAAGRSTNGGRQYDSLYEDGDEAEEEVEAGAEHDVLLGLMTQDPDLEEEAREGHGASPLPGGIIGGCGGGCGAAGVTSPLGRQRQRQGQPQGLAGDSAGRGALSPEEARRAAEQSAAMRRDYRMSAQSIAVLSKSRERQLREEATRAELAHLMPPPSPSPSRLPSAATGSLHAGHMQVPQLQPNQPQLQPNQPQLHHTHSSPLPSQLPGPASREMPRQQSLAAQAAAPPPLVRLADDNAVRSTAEQLQVQPPSVGLAEEPSMAASVPAQDASGRASEALQPPPKRRRLADSCAGPKRSSPRRGEDNPPSTASRLGQPCLNDRGALPAPGPSKPDHRSLDHGAEGQREPRPPSGLPPRDTCDILAGDRDPRVSDDSPTAILGHCGDASVGGNAGVDGLHGYSESERQAPDGQGLSAAELDAAVLTYRVVDLYGDVVREACGAESGSSGGDGSLSGYGSGDDWGGSSSDGGGIASLPCGWDMDLDLDVSGAEAAGASPAAPDAGRWFSSDAGGAADESEAGLSGDDGLGFRAAQGPPHPVDMGAEPMAAPALLPTVHDGGWHPLPQVRTDAVGAAPLSSESPLRKNENLPQHQQQGQQQEQQQAPAGRQAPLFEQADRQQRVPALGGQQQPQQRVFLHVDVDCFYCQVERLDDPSLVGKPLAVTQFNSGGFVAVSYEARAAGIRCGDGVGAGGRAAIPYLKSMGAVSLAEAQRRCPGLIVRPMRTERYRRVAEQVHALLRRFAPDGQVEKTSYDDFYLDVTAACLSRQPSRAASRQSTPGPPITEAAPSRRQPELRLKGQPESALGADATRGGVTDVNIDFVDAVLGGNPLGLGFDPDPDVDLDRDLDMDLDADRAPDLYPRLGAGPHRVDGADGRRQRSVDGRVGALAPTHGAQTGVAPAYWEEDLDHVPVGVAPQSGHDAVLEWREGSAEGSVEGLDGGPPPPRVHVADCSAWSEVEEPLRRGVKVAQDLRQALKDALSFTVSVGVAPTKLSARLAGPANKPDAITVVPAARLQHFMAGVRIQSVPTLAGKTGSALVSELGVERVGQLAAIPRRELLARFGSQVGALLAELPYGGPRGDTGGGSGGGGATGGSVRERGPQKSILVERSFPPITRFGGVKEALEPMVGALWERMVDDAVQNRRMPNKLLLTWRQGYGAPKTKSADVSVQLLQALKAAAAAASATAAASAGGHHATPNHAANVEAKPPPHPAGGSSGVTITAGAGPAGSATVAPEAAAGGKAASGSGAGEGGGGARWTQPGAVPGHTYQGCRAMLEGAAAIFKAAIASTRNAMQITRLAVGVGFGATDTTDTTAGQRSISAFAKQQQKPGAAPAAQTGVAPPPGASASGPAESKLRARGLDAGAGGAAASLASAPGPGAASSCGLRRPVLSASAAVPRSVHVEEPSAARHPSATAASAAIASDAPVLPRGQPLAFQRRAEGPAGLAAGESRPGATVDVGGRVVEFGTEERGRDVEQPRAVNEAQGVASENGLAVRRTAPGAAITDAGVADATDYVSDFPEDGWDFSFAMEMFTPTRR